MIFAKGPNKAIKNRPQAGWTSVALLVLRLFATLTQNHQYDSGLLWRRYCGLLRRYAAALLKASLMQKILKMILVVYLLILSGCSMLYMNAVRHDVVLEQGERRGDVISRYGEPIHSTDISDTFSIRGRYTNANDPNRVAGALTAFTLGLGEIVVFPYILVSESIGAVGDRFCVVATYGSDNLVVGYNVLTSCN